MGPGGGHSGGVTTVDGEAVDPLLGAADLEDPHPPGQRKQRKPRKPRKNKQVICFWNHLESLGYIYIYIYIEWHIEDTHATHMITYG